MWKGLLRHWIRAIQWFLLLEDLELLPASAGGVMSKKSIGLDCVLSPPDGIVLLPCSKSVHLSGQPEVCVMVNKGARTVFPIGSWL